MDKRLLIFSMGQGPNIKDLSPQSNSWYIKNYEFFFDRVYHLLLAGESAEVVTNGKSEFHFSGSGNGITDMLFAPIRFYRFVKKTKPAYIITYEQIWLWWIILPSRVFMNTRVYLMPMTVPEQMYKVTGKAISGRLPIWLERIFLKWSYRSSYKVLTSFNLGNYINWMKENKIISRKLKITDALPESVVFPQFMNRLNELSKPGKGIVRNDTMMRLIYVGRLHIEKMTDHLIKAMPIILSKVPNAHLSLIGQGPDKEALIKLAGELGISEAVTFHDYVPNSALPDHLLGSDIFVSPITGHAFREAAICGLPIVAYNIDWIKGFLTHNETFYSIDTTDYNAMAEGVITMCLDNELRQKISLNIKKFASRYWSHDQLLPSMESIFSKIE
jgi:glycosyltransferase involved in cell wall biosynthesis